MGARRVQGTLVNAGVLAGVNWVWTLALASAAVVVLAAAGIDRFRSSWGRC